MDKKYLQQIKISEFSNIKKGDDVTLLNGNTFIAGDNASQQNWQVKDTDGNSYSAKDIASPYTLKQDDTKYQTLSVNVACRAHYNSEIRVPKDLNRDEAIEYAKNHLDEAPLGNLEYISDLDEFEIC